MTKRILISLLWLILIRTANSQDVSYGFRTGIGTYSMHGLKEINSEVPKSLPFDCKLVDNFPPYLYYRPSIMLNFENFSLGLIYSFQSTGSRISAKDYSGEYRFDMKINSNAPGIYSELKLPGKSKFDFWIYSIIGPSFSNLEIKELFNVADTVLTNDKFKFKALNYFVEPGINCQFHLGSFNLGIDLGYWISIGDQPLYTGNNKKNIIISNNIPVQADWNGLRVGLSVSYGLFRKINNQGN